MTCICKIQINKNYFKSIIMFFFNVRYKESRVALEAAVDCLKFSPLEDGKKKKFLKDVQDSMHKVNTACIM